MHAQRILCWRCTEKSIIMGGVARVRVSDTTGVAFTKITKKSMEMRLSTDTPITVWKSILSPIGGATQGKSAPTTLVGKIVQRLVMNTPLPAHELAN